jgi:hypothetical protein
MEDGTLSSPEDFVTDNRLSPGVVLKVKAFRTEACCFHPFFFIHYARARPLHPQLEPMINRVLTPGLMWEQDWSLSEHYINFGRASRKAEERKSSFGSRLCYR